MTTPSGAASQPAGTGRMQMPGFNQLQSSIDKLTTAVSNLTAAMGGGGPGGNGGWRTLVAGAAGGGANAGGAGFSMGVALNAIASGGNAGFGSQIGGYIGGQPGAAVGGAAGAVAATGGPLWATPSGMGTYNTMQWTLNQLSMGGNGATQGRLAGGMYGAGRGYAANPAISGFGAADASSGYGNLYFGSGSTNGTLNSLGTNMNAAAAAMWAANPALTYAQRSQMSQNMYSSSTYMNLLLMGFNRNQMPVGPGGQNQNPAAFLQAIGQRAFGTNKALSQQQVAGLFSQFGQGQYVANAMGLPTDVLRQMTMQYEQGRARGMTQNQMAQMYSDLSSGNATAQAQGRKLAARAGINFKSIQNAQESTQALGTQRAAELMPAFATGLEQAVAALNKFNSWLNSQIGGGGIIGGASRFLSGLGGLFGGVHPPRQGNVAPSGGGGGGGTSTSKPPPAAPGGISGAAKAAVGAAERELGLPYVWGGETPGVGFDCSGLVQWAYGQAGVKLPRVSWDQWSALKNKQVPLSQVQEGDIIFTAGSDGTASKPGHVAMMVDQHTLIQAPYTGQNVQLTPFNKSDWLYAARPSGSLSGSMSSGGNGTASTGSGNGSASSTGGPAKGVGAGMGSYADEAAALSGMMSGILGNVGFANTGASGTGNGGGNGTASMNGSSPGFNFYARGTLNAAPGPAVVGESGREVVMMQGGEQIYNAGQMGLLRGSGGVNIHVNIGTGAINIGGGGSVSGLAPPPGTPGFTPTDIRNTAQAIGDQVATALAKHSLIQRLAAGTS